MFLLSEGSVRRVCDVPVVGLKCTLLCDVPVVCLKCALLCDVPVVRLKRTLLCDVPVVCLKCTLLCDVPVVCFKCTLCREECWTVGVRVTNHFVCCMHGNTDDAEIKCMT